MPAWRQCFTYLEIYKCLLGVAMVIGFLTYEAKSNSDWVSWKQTKKQ